MEETQHAASPTTLFPEPADKDFEDDIGEEERKYYIEKYKDMSTLKNGKFHCTACDKHLGTAPKSEGRMRVHPMLKTLVCRPCHTFYNSGEFERGDDGSELYCRWCGQGGQVYCCSGCPTVFCAKCVKRNLGQSKIREIESMDDWKCFRCAPKVLWDLRADCWALLRHCEHKNRLVHMTTDAELKEKYQKECSIDQAECCKNRRRTATPVRKREVKEEKTKEEKAKEEKVLDPEEEKSKALAKIPSGIKVKKFASINPDVILKSTLEKKAVKRPASPIKFKQMGIRAPIPIAPFPRPIISNIMGTVRNINPPPTKKPRYQSPQVYHTYSAQRFKARAQSPMRANAPHFGTPNFNGYNSFVNTDNINLSLESLTQGLDMNAVNNMANMANIANMASMASMTSIPNMTNVASGSMVNDIIHDSGNDELVCTPDFPLEPLCEVTEDSVDDDVECITPGPVAPPKPSLQPQRTLRSLPDISPDNIVQMTENDVTVNAVTGGLKFRVDPQTLCANKMYRLPDGRIFAINSNPNMPGGYSATIVAVSETTPNSSSGSVRGTTFRANVNPVVSPAQKTTKKTVKKPDKPKPSRPELVTENPTRRSRRIQSRTPDMNTSVEWYRYHIIDSIDALKYSLERLERLKTQADTHFLRTRTVDEMKALHTQLERHLRTSYSRFHEIRDNLYKGYKNYLKEKGKKQADNNEDDDDDDVEILNDSTRDDPIFIDENSIDAISDNEVTTLSSENIDTGELDNSKNVDPLADVETQANQKQCEENSTNAEMEVDSISKNIVEVNKHADKDTAEDSDSKEIENDSSVTAKESENINNLNSSTEITPEDLKNQKAHHHGSENSDGEEGKEDVNQEKEDKEIKESQTLDAESTKENETDEESTKENENVHEESIDSKTVDEESTKQNETEQEESILENKSVDEEKTENETEDEESSKQNETVDEEKTENETLDVKSTERNEIVDKVTIVDVSEVINKENNEESLNKVSNSDDENVSEKEIEDNTTNASNISLQCEDSTSTVTKTDDVKKINGSQDASMEVDTNGDVNKDNDNEIQMSDEMIDNLLADDGPHEEMSEELQKLTERSLDSLVDTDLMNSDFN